MTKTRRIPLTQMRSGQNGIIVQIMAGYSLINRLSDLGLYIGKQVMVLSSFRLRGPVTIKANGTQVAIGFGMARHIIVEVNEFQS